MLQEPKIGPDIKLCAHRDCVIPFTRPQNMHNRTWKRCTLCPKHRKKSGDHKPEESKLGKYVVKNEALDRFLYGR